MQGRANRPKKQTNARQDLAGAIQILLEFGISYVELSAQTFILWKGAMTLQVRQFARPCTRDMCLLRVETILFYILVKTQTALLWVERAIKR